MIAQDWKEDVVQLPLNPPPFVSLGLALQNRNRPLQQCNDFLNVWKRSFWLAKVDSLTLRQLLIQ